MTKLQRLANLASKAVYPVGKKQSTVARKNAFTELDAVLIDLICEPKESAYYLGSGIIDLDEALAKLLAARDAVNGFMPDEAQNSYGMPVERVVDELIALGGLV